MNIVTYMKQEASRCIEREKEREGEGEREKEKKRDIYQAEGRQLYENPACAALARTCTPTSQS
jgi:hypothetical protein